MSIVRKNNIQLQNPETKAFLADAVYPDQAENLPLIIFCHGYKGYKDWGAWSLMAEKFAVNGYFFVKFNYSHNGTTLEHPTDFADLEAFGNDNYSKQLSDLEWVIDYFSKNARVDPENIILMGHSRGGGLVTVKAAEDKRVKKLITLAGVDTLDFFPKGDRFEEWKKNGVFYSKNGRTQQEMPHYFQIFEDYQRNSNRYNVGNKARSFHGQSLIIHGSADEAVALSAAEHLHAWLKDSDLKIIENAHHTFGAKEPWESGNLPQDLEVAVETALHFLK